LIAGVVSDDVLIEHKGVTPVIPLAERLEIVRNVRFVDAAHVAMTNDKVEIWNDLRFNVLFKGDDWQGTEKGNKLERDFSALGVYAIPCAISTCWPRVAHRSNSFMRPDRRSSSLQLAGQSPLWFLSTQALSGGCLQLRSTIRAATAGTGWPMFD
jgi:hypothetical protein